MVKAGVLLHVYHLEVVDWEKLVWGEPALGKLGSLPKLAQLLLTQPADESIEGIVVYTGPSEKEGLGEGAFMKKFLLDHFSELEQFPQLQPLLFELSADQKDDLKQKIESITLGPQLVNTLDEVVNAAAYFEHNGITKVYQIAASSHGPRCIQMQAIVRSEGHIPSHQRWFTVISDMPFAGTTPGDVVVVEPPHRGDDPTLGIHPTLAEIIRPYFRLSAEKKAAALQVLKEAMDVIIQG